MNIEIKVEIKITVRKLEMNCNGYYCNRGTKLPRQVWEKSTLYPNTQLQLYIGISPMTFLSSSSFLSPHLP